MTHKAVMVDVVFAALADDSRRHVLERLGETGQASASHLAAAMPISRQAIAKHLQQLEAAGLVTRERRGRQIEFRVDPDQLAATGRFLQRIAERWADRR